MNDLTRPDYFELSRQAALFAQMVADVLTRRVVIQAEMFLREGFVVTDPNALQTAADNFIRFKSWPGGAAALSQNTTQERAVLIAAVASHFAALQDAIDLTFSSAWVDFINSPARALIIRQIRAFGVTWRQDPSGTLTDLDTDWRRHYAAESYDR